MMSAIFISVVPQKRLHSPIIYRAKRKLHSRRRATAIIPQILVSSCLLFYPVPSAMETLDANFVAWFRQASPYIHAHRGRTFVICFTGEAVDSPGFAPFIHDIALLHSLGIRVVLAPGTRSQIDRCMAARDLIPAYAQGVRITDEAALECVKHACGQVSANIQALLSMGLTNSPSVDADIRVAMGNFIDARPLGVRDGVDFLYSGEVRRVDSAAISRQLDAGAIVLLTPLGYSPTGEVFNLAVEEIATSVAVALKAAKWICLSETDGLREKNGGLIQQLTVEQAEQQIAAMPRGSDIARQLRYAMQACRGGVERAHILERKIDGGLLLELFSREGVGTLVSKNPFENMRTAGIGDVGGVLELIRPLEEAGILVRRSREKLEMEISQFVVQERDGMIIACAALYPFPGESMAELACVAVHSNYRGENRGDAMLAFMEQQARQAGIRRLFVLTTRTAHWFQERGFSAAGLDALPMQRRALYNFQRKSKVFIKDL
jgi:amino-acid N-acetyltransferase